MGPKSVVAKVKYEDTVEAQSQAVLKGPRTLEGVGGSGSDGFQGIRVQDLVAYKVGSVPLGMEGSAFCHTFIQESLRAILFP